MSQELWRLASERLLAELPPQQFNTWIRPLAVQVHNPAQLPLAGLALEAPVDPKLHSKPDDAPGSAPAPGTGGKAVPAPGPKAAWLVQIRVPNLFKLEWIRGQYQQRLQSILEELAAAPVKLELLLQPHKPELAGSMALRRQLPQAAASIALDALGHGQHALEGQSKTDPGSNLQSHLLQHLALDPLAHDRQSQYRALAPGSASRAVARPSTPSHKLDPQLSFDTLVAGRANQMARTAALHVAGAPGVSYNPLFIYGGVGVGKTHLVHAVGNALLQDRPQARVQYLHAEQFISDVVRNYQRKTFDELKAKYHSLDLLLIDDVQFFAGKERTQEEFFNAFEALLSKKAHIIMTSDTYPKGLADIDERLKSRFDAGLTVAIEPPELEMRVAILMRKSAIEAIEMPEDVAFFIAKNVRANVRELEGALRKVLAHSRFNHREISVPLAKEALKDLLSIHNRQISVENIQKTVADFYKIKVADMYSKKRPASIARPRQIAMYVAKEMTQKSLPEIGDLFGGRDHTTVLHAVRKIAAERTVNAELNQQLHVLEQTLKG